MEARVVGDASITKGGQATPDPYGIGPAIDQVDEGVVITDARGSILYVNAAFTRMTGFTFLEVVGRNPRMLKTGHQDSSYYRDLWSTIQAGRTWQGRLINRRKDGSTYTEEMTITPVRDSRGEIARYVAIKRDVSARQVAEEAQKFLAAILASSDDAIIGKELDGTIESWNRGAEELLQYQAEEVVGKPISILLPADLREQLLPILESNRAGQSLETALLAKNGRRVDVSVTVFPIRNTLGDVVGSATMARDISARRREQQTLRESEERFRIMADGCPTLVWVTGNDGGLQFVNRTYREFFGASYEQVQGSKWQPLLHPDDTGPYIKAFLAAVKLRAAFTGATRVRRADGEWRWITSNAAPRFSTSNEFLGHVGVSTDVTESRQAEQALRRSEEKFRELTENIREVFWMMNEAGDEILYISPAYAQIWGRPCEELYAHPMSWLESIEPDDREAAHAVFLRQMDGEDIESEYRVRTPLGEVKWVRDRAFPVRNEAGEIMRVVGIAEDISARKKAEMELEHQAGHDHLTGLPNRLLSSDGLEASIGRAAREGLVTAVIYVDLDGFKFVNDTLGHEAGDALLQEATVRLQGCVREPDMLARMGGDEFMVIVNDVRNDDIARSVAERLRQAMRKSFHLSDRELYLSASLGIAMYPRDGVDVTTLRGNADAAMYEAKRAGKDRIQFFTPAMRIKLQERLEMDTELRRALDGNQLTLHYQPIFETQGGEQTAFEALLRWNHPELGVIPPAKFIPLAEESGLIVSIGAWVLEEACRQCRAWQHRGLAGVRVAVNVSPVEFALPEFAGGVLRVLDQTGLPGELLDLELTETTLMRDMDSAMQRMASLRERGIRISIDDFGTGYSSLGYLPRLPVDMLKIDRSFVADLGKNTSALMLIQGMISLAHSIGKRVVVEGVETNEQLETLQRAGADEIQGFLLGCPGPLPSDYD